MSDRVKNRGYEPHRFVPYNANWVKPRCTVCQQFEDHELHVDTRIVYGARCTWWDSIKNVSTTESGLPVCPHCGSPLFETDNPEKWWSLVDKFAELQGWPEYREMIEWSAGRCFTNFNDLKVAYEEAKDG